MAAIKIAERIFVAFGALGWIELFGAFVVMVGCAGELWILANKLTRRIEPIGKTASRFLRFLAWIDVKIRPLLLFLKINGRKLSEPKEQLLERFFVLLVAFGVMLEFICLPFSMSEIASLNNEAGRARLEAGQANERAAHAELKVEALRKENSVLKARQITTEQYNKFIEILKNRPKHPVMVYVEKGNFEAEAFAGEIRKMLDDAGYGFPQRVGLEKFDLFNRSPTIGDASRDIPVFVIFYGESPTAPIVWPHFKITAPVNGQSEFVEDADDPSAAGFVIDAFRQIEIKTSTMVRKEFGKILKPGEWAIWIPQKF